MRSLIMRIDKDDEFALKLLVSSIFDANFGKTINEINSDELSSKYLIPIEINPLRKFDMNLQLSKQLWVFLKLLMK